MRSGECGGRKRGSAGRRSVRLTVGSIRGRLLRFRAVAVAERGLGRGERSERSVVRAPTGSGRYVVGLVVGRLRICASPQVQHLDGAKLNGVTLAL